MTDEAAAKPNPQLDADRFKTAEHERNVWTATVEPGITREQITNSAFWSHMAAKLRPYDQIEVRCDDGRFFGQLLVMSAERTWAKVRVLAWHDFTRDVTQAQPKKDDPDAPPVNYKVEWKGPHKKWCVIRLSDSTMVHEEAASKEDAQRWLDGHLRVVA